MSTTPAATDKTVHARGPRASIEDLLQAHRRELLVHCYRMLGSWTDAEDVMQDVSLRAWRGLDRFEARSSPRSWLYRIATNACLSARRSRARRTLPEVAVPPVALGALPAPPIEDARWIQPFPSGRDVEAMASSRESVTLAFVLALQHLPPRQRAALLLRDVVGYEAGEVAAMLKTSTQAINSALIRARARMARFRERPGVSESVAPLTPLRTRC
jgi:RNA polymerase sigma-70 factor, ECF subfamily